MSDINLIYTVKGLKLLFDQLHWSMLFVSFLFKALDIEYEIIRVWTFYIQQTWKAGTYKGELQKENFHYVTL